MFLCWTDIRPRGRIGPCELPILRTGIKSVSVAAENAFSAGPNMGPWALLPVAFHDARGNPCVRTAQPYRMVRKIGTDYALSTVR